MLCLQLSGSLILAIFSDLCTGSRYKKALNAKLFPCHISSSSLLLHVTCAISSQSSLLNPLHHLHWSLSSNNDITSVSRSQTGVFGMLHITRGTSFFALRVPYQFDPSSSPSFCPSSGSDRELVVKIFLMAFSLVVLKPFLS